MVVGDAMVQYFRKESCIYLTKVMFKYLRIVYEDLLEQAAAGEVNPYMLASLSSIARLLKINLRCLSICRLDLQEIVTKAECDGYEQLQSKLNADKLKKDVAARAKLANDEAEARAKAKEAKDKEEEEKAKAKEKEDEKKAAEEEKKDESEKVIIKTDGSGPVAAAKKAEPAKDEKKDGDA